MSTLESGDPSPGLQEKKTDTFDLPENPASLLGAFRNFFKRPDNSSLAAAILLFVAAIWVGTEVVEKSKTVKEFVRGILASGFTQDIPEGNQLQTWMALLVVLFAGIFFVLLLTATANYLIARSARLARETHRKREHLLQISFDNIRSEYDKLKGVESQLIDERDRLRVQLDREQQQVQAALSARNAKLQKTLRGTIHAASLIRNQLNPAGTDSAGKTVQKVHYIYYISKDFNAIVHRRYRIRAEDAPLHFWQIQFNFSAQTMPTETFVDMNFQLTNQDPRDAGTNLVYLPTRNDPFQKSVCIFFLPRIEKGMSREIGVSYSWPRMFANLATLGREDLAVSFHNKGLLEEYRLEIYLEPGTGGALSAAQTGIQLPNMRLEPNSSYHGWPGFIYSGTNVTAESLENEIVLTVGWNPA